MKRFNRVFRLVLAMVAILLVPAGAAQADPFHLDITDAVMDLGSLSGVRAIDSKLVPPDPPATLDGGLTAGKVSVPIAGFVFPEKEAEVSPGITAKINMEANEDITGTWDEASGKLVLDANLKARVGVLGADCTISPIELVLSTDNSNPYLGVEFATGLGGPGAIGAAWEALPAVTGGGFCSTVGSLIAGPGGIWMSQDIYDFETCDTDRTNTRCGQNPSAPTAEPRIISRPDSVTESTTADLTYTKGEGETQDVTGFDCSLDGSAFEACDSGSKSYTGLAVGSHTFKVKSSNGAGEGPEATQAWTVKAVDISSGMARFGALKIKPRNKKVKRGKKVVLKAKVSNTGDVAAQGVKICVKAPKKLVKVKKCVKVGSIAAGATKRAKFKVTVKKKAKRRKKITLKFIATGKGLAKKTGKVRVKVK